MRQGGKTRRSSTQENLLLEAVTARLTAVEERVLRLEEAECGFPLSSDEATKHKAGRPEKISDGELVGRRDRLIGWLESLWPELAVRLPAAKNANEIRTILATYKSEMPASYMADRADALCDFLKSRRFRRKPPRGTVERALNGDWMKSDTFKAAMGLPTRQIASALAGVAILKWRTSFDRCMRKPSSMAVGRAASEHFRIVHQIPWPSRIWTQAEDGNSQAQFWIGLSYANGIGVEKNERAAADWFGRATKQGHIEATIALKKLKAKAHR